VSESYTYIGVRPCGCIRAAVVDAPETPRQVAKDVAGFIAHGLKVERVLTESVRTTSWRCGVHMERELQQQTWP
jgi:hypothetical protein